MKRAGFLILLFLAACTGTSPEPDYYDLAPVHGTPVPGLKLSIKIQRPSLPAYLDRPDIVREVGAYSYKVDEFHRWIEPLDRMFERILTEDLRQRLPDSTVLSEADTGTMNSQYIMETAIEQFNATGDKTVALKAVLSIHDKTGTHSFAPQRIELTGPAAESPSSLAAALSDLIAAYADRVAAGLQSGAVAPQK